MKIKSPFCNLKVKKGCFFLIIFLHRLQWRKENVKDAEIMKERGLYKKGLTIVETILVSLCILFFIIGGLLLKYDRPLIEENNNINFTYPMEVKVTPVKNDTINQEGKINNENKSNVNVVINKNTGQNK